MSNGTFSCEDVVSSLSDYVDGESPPNEVKLIELHLADCPNCAAFLNTFRGSLALARKLGGRAVPEGTLARLHRALERKTGLTPEMPPMPPSLLEGEGRVEDEDRL